MEPTLIAVLAVKSLRKLELVGDHRQLPAFIQNCWFNTEMSSPSIKTSLFERLISGKIAPTRGRSRRDADGAERVPSTILDVQRRMRSQIADLTRPDYEDIVKIQDHSHTKTQCIGDVYLKSQADKISSLQFRDHRALWPRKGILVTILIFVSLSNKNCANRSRRPRCRC